MHNNTWMKWVARFYHHGHFKSCRETIVLQKLRAESFREASSIYQYGCQEGIHRKFGSCTKTYVSFRVP